MFIRASFGALLVVAAVSLFAVCDGPPQPRTTTSQEEKLTPERARQALLRMMRSEAGQRLGWFRGEVPEEMAKMPVEEGKDGWYRWTAFGFNPSRAVYTLVVEPRGGGACMFEYEGSFVREAGRWVATPPRVRSIAMMHPREDRIGAHLTTAARL